jgi:hypothetical protein
MTTECKDLTSAILHPSDLSTCFVLKKIVAKTRSIIIIIIIIIIKIRRRIDAVNEATKWSVSMFNPIALSHIDYLYLRQNCCSERH